MLQSYYLGRLGWSMKFWKRSLEGRGRLQTGQRVEIALCLSVCLSLDRVYLGCAGSRCTAGLTAEGSWKGLFMWPMLASRVRAMGLVPNVVLSWLVCSWK